MQNAVNTKIVEEINKLLEGWQENEEDGVVFIATVEDLEKRNEEDGKTEGVFSSVVLGNEDAIGTCFYNLWRRSVSGPHDITGLVTQTLMSAVADK